MLKFNQLDTLKIDRILIVSPKFFFFFCSLKDALLNNIREYITKRVVLFFSSLEEGEGYRGLLGRMSGLRERENSRTN